MSGLSTSRQHAANARPPRVSALRLVGPAAEHARGRIPAPLGAVFNEGALANAVVLGPADVADVASLARALPEPDDLTSGALVVVLPEVIDSPSLARRFLAAFGRGRTVSRALRASALVSRGYVRVAAGIDHQTRSDLVWGFTPDEAVVRALTERPE